MSLRFRAECTSSRTTQNSSAYFPGLPLANQPFECFSGPVGPYMTLRRVCANSSLHEYALGGETSSTTATVSALAIPAYVPLSFKGLAVLQSLT